MTKLIITAGVLVFVVIAIHVLELLIRDGVFSSKPKYQYGRKDFIMTRAEHECYDALVAEMGADYFFFPQIHLDSIVIPKDTTKNRLYAFRHINQKSLDFVACDKKYIRPLFAIELDDKTHNQPKRIERDEEVERILRGAGIPLIRIENRGRFEPKELAQFVQNGIERFATKPQVA
jgi:very-short-patch-repair endonuclease